MRVMSNGKVRRTAAEWQEVLSRCEKSGLSPRAFCHKEEIHLSSFVRWQRKLAAPTRSREFVPVTPTRPASSSWSLEISLPNGCKLRFRG
jgi:hypothetical protein